MTDVPLLPLRLLTHPFGDDGLYHSLLAHPGRSALYAVRVPRCRGLASGFLPTPLRSDAVASGSGLASPLPLEDFHLQSITHAGRTITSGQVLETMAGCQETCIDPSANQKTG